jgi:hypothetical protein
LQLKALSLMQSRSSVKLCLTQLFLMILNGEQLMHDSWAWHVISLIT